MDRPGVAQLDKGTIPLPSHTPGPWSVYGVGRMQRNIQSTDRTIAVVHGDLLDTPHNARLIAAAPELLEALSAIRDFCDDPAGSEHWETLALGLSRLLPAARAAVNKATGK